MSTPKPSQNTPDKSETPNKSKTPYHPKRIQPIGNERTHIENIIDDRSKIRMEEDAKNNDILTIDQIESVSQLANHNPTTKKLIEEAKIFTSINKDKIKKQCTDMVALYNIGKEKPFFFITPAEARLAINHIKQCRSGYIKELEDKNEKDLFVQDFINNLNNIGIQTNIEKLKNINDKILIEETGKEIDELCGIEINEIENPYEVKIETEEAEIKLNSNPKDIFNINKTGIPRFTVINTCMDALNLLPSNPGDYNLSLNELNQMMSTMEYQNLLVDVLIVNSHRVADIRNFGKTVYDEYSIKEQIKRKCFGKLFTMEIYPCNKLLDNQIIIGSLAYDYGIFYNIMMK